MLSCAAESFLSASHGRFFSIPMSPLLAFQALKAACPYRAMRQARWMLAMFHPSTPAAHLRPACEHHARAMHTIYFHQQGCRVMSTISGLLSIGYIFVPRQQLLSDSVA